MLRATGDGGGVILGRATRYQGYYPWITAAMKWKWPLLRLRMSRAIPPLLYAFMEWTQTTLPLP